MVARKPALKVHRTPAPKAAAQEPVVVKAPELTAAQRRELRAKAHHLHPVVAVGHHGLTPSVLHELDVNLLAHELIKVRVFSDARDEREQMLARICTELDAAPVQHIGKLLVVWRPAPAEPAPKKAVRDVRRRGSPAAPAKPATPAQRRRARESEDGEPRGKRRPLSRPVGKTTKTYQAGSDTMAKSTPQARRPRAPEARTTRAPTPAAAPPRDSTRSPTGGGAPRSRAKAAPPGPSTRRRGRGG